MPTSCSCTASTSRSTRCWLDFCASHARDQSQQIRPRAEEAGNNGRRKEIGWFDTVLCQDGGEEEVRSA